MEISDRLLIYDGDSSSAPLIGRYCGRSTPEGVISSTNLVFMRFESNTKIGYDGFVLEYHSNSEFLLHYFHLPPLTSTWLPIFVPIYSFIST